MCPLCIGTATLLVSSGASAAGLSALVLKPRICKHPLSHPARAPSLTLCAKPNSGESKPCDAIRLALYRTICAFRRRAITVLEGCYSMFRLARPCRSEESRATRSVQWD